MTDGPLALTIAAAAEALSVSPRTVRRLIDRGELAPIRIGRSVRLSTEDLHAYIDRQKPRGHNANGVAVPGDTICRDVRPSRTDRQASMLGPGARIGGPSTRTGAGARLAEVLGLDAATTRKD